MRVTVDEAVWRCAIHLALVDEFDGGCVLLLQRIMFNETGVCTDWSRAAPLRIAGELHYGNWLGWLEDSLLRHFGLGSPLRHIAARCSCRVVLVTRLREPTREGTERKRRQPRASVEAFIENTLPMFQTTPYALDATRSLTCRLSAASASATSTACRPTPPPLS